MKLFDAVEGAEGIKPHVILRSTIDSRDLSKLETFPAHHDENDKVNFRETRAALESEIGFH